MARPCSHRRAREASRAGVVKLTCTSLLALTAQRARCTRTSSRRPTTGYPASRHRCRAWLRPPVALAVPRQGTTMSVRTTLSPRAAPNRSIHQPSRAWPASTCAGHASLGAIAMRAATRGLTLAPTRRPQSMRGTRRRSLRARAAHSIEMSAPVVTRFSQGANVREARRHTWGCVVGL